MFGGKKEGQADDKVDTIIGKETVIKGAVLARANLRVEGLVEGDIKGQGIVVIGEGAQVKGNIAAKAVSLSGQVTGNIEAQGRLEITTKGRLQGDIKVEQLIIEEGGIFQGKSEMNGTAEKSSSHTPPKKE
ncbi:MAG: polymer-forming cytoskeletal protein [Firmicutes bacterium]|nr:polymer-forming cytoskeletal protein [Bacillota bacterium]MCL5040534.1 polymer-forming cytoskeletal protein [Bacillota bacterium]